MYMVDIDDNDDDDDDVDDDLVFFWMLPGLKDKNDVQTNPTSPDPGPVSISKLKSIFK